ncbi:MAG TPA: hypothetical protein VL977_02670 [Solirubrobacteraceae bacterium]|nr:hypothetical protein [Solirubrobacteraceae bacterium]
MASIDARAGAALLAAGRAALGAAVLAAPERVASRWLGADASNPVVVDLARSLGARDVALGAAVLQTLDDPVAGPRVQAACAAVDCVDLLATLAARRHLPRAGVVATVAVAGAAAAAGFCCSHRLAHA